MVAEQYSEVDDTGQDCSPANIRCGIISANSRACSLYCLLCGQSWAHSGLGHNTGSRQPNTGAISSTLAAGMEM